MGRVTGRPGIRPTTIVRSAARKAFDESDDDSQAVAEEVGASGGAHPVQEPQEVCVLAFGRRKQRLRIGPQAGRGQALHLVDPLGEGIDRQLVWN